MFLLYSFFLFLLLMMPTRGKSSSPSPHQQYFISIPQDVEVVEGTSSVDLHCRVGNLMGRVQWSKDGFLLGYDAEIQGFPRYFMNMDPQTGVYNFQIKNILLEDEGDYQCQVGPGANNNKPIRAGAKVSVIIPPTQLVVSPFYTNSLLPIETTKISIPSSHKDDDQSSGHKNNNQTNHDKTKHHLRHHNKHNRQHNKHQQQKHKNPTQSNNINNGSISTSHSITMIEVSEGEKIMLKCRTVTPTKPVTQLSWFRNGQPINPNDYGIKEKVSQEDERDLFTTESTLNLFVKLEDKPTDMKCVASHPALKDGVSLSDELRISILTPPSRPEIEGFTPGEDTLMAGDKITLACMSRGGNPTPSLIWYREGDVVDSSSSSSPHPSTNINGGDGLNGLLSTTTNTFSFVVRPEDNRRVFRCEASNLIQTVSSEVKLDVHFPAIDIKLKGPTVGKINDILRYECLIGPSNPLPNQVTWMINGLPQKEGVYPVESWKEEVSYGFMTKTNITVLLTESIKTISCMASSSSSSSSTTISPTTSAVSALLSPSSSNHRHHHHLASSNDEAGMDLTAISASLNVHVLFPPGEPTIIGYESGQELREGDILKLKCGSLGGYPLPTIRWVKLTKQSLESKEISGLESRNGHSGVSSELYVRVTPSDNEATYKCIVSNEAITTPLTSSIVLFPVYFMSSQLKITPSDSLVVKSDSNSEIVDDMEEEEDSKKRRIDGRSTSQSTLECESEECFPSCNLTWYQDGYRLEPTRDSIVSSTATGNFGEVKTRSKLILSRRKWTSAQDGSIITCSSSNSFLPSKRNSKNVTIQVLYKPEFPSSNRTSTFDVVEGSDDFEIHLPAKGNPPLIHYFWSKNGISLSNNKRMQMNSSTLVIHRVTRDDHGVYSVRAANTEGSSNTSFTLNVLFGSFIERTSSKDILIRPGDSVNLTCYVNPGNPGPGMNPLQIVWKLRKRSRKFLPQKKLQTPASTSKTGRKTPTSASTSTTGKKNYSKNKIKQNDQEKTNIQHQVKGRYGRYGRGEGDLAGNRMIRKELRNVVVKEEGRHEESKKGREEIRNEETKKTRQDEEDDEEEEILEEETLVGSSIEGEEGSLRISYLIIRDEGGSKSKKRKEKVGERDEDGDYDEGNDEDEREDEESWNEKEGLKESDVFEDEKERDEEDEKKYICSSFNGVGFRDEEEFTVKRMKPPVILRKKEKRKENNISNYNNNYKSSTGKLNKKNRSNIAIADYHPAYVATDGSETSIELTCKAKGRPTPIFTWFERERQITGREEFYRRFSIISSSNSQDGKKTEDGRPGVQFGYVESSPDVTVSRLIIKHVSVEDIDRKFKCVATNEVGRDEMEVILRRKGKPDPPVNVHVVSSTWNSVHLKWEEGFDGGHNTWYVVRVNDQVEVQVEANEISLEGLKGGKEYLITIRSANAPFGTSKDSVSFVVTTPEKEDSLPDEEDGRGQLIAGRGESPSLSGLITGGTSFLHRFFSKISRPHQLVLILVITLGCLSMSIGMFFLILIYRRRTKGGFIPNECSSTSSSTHPPTTETITPPSPSPTSKSSSCKKVGKMRTYPGFCQIHKEHTREMES